jgi:hypothetical protein
VFLCAERVESRNCRLLTDHAKQQKRDDGSHGYDCKLVRRPDCLQDGLVVKRAV